MSNFTIWVTILGLGGATMVIRFSFLAFFGHHELPEWLQRHLRYVAVAILPGMVAVLVAYPRSKGGALDAVWIISALACFTFGFFIRKPLIIMIVGAVVFMALSAMRSYGILF